MLFEAERLKHFREALLPDQRPRSVCRLDFVFLEVLARPRDFPMVFFRIVSMLSHNLSSEAKPWKLETSRNEPEKA